MLTIAIFSEAIFSKAEKMNMSSWHRDEGVPFPGNHFSLSWEENSQATQKAMENKRFESCVHTDLCSGCSQPSLISGRSAVSFRGN